MYMYMDETQDAAALDPFELEEQMQQAESQSVSLGSPVTDGEQSPPSESTGNDQIIVDILASNGISDASKIKFEENGQVIERSWNDLTKQEKINILNSGNLPDPDTELDDEEIDFINQLRLSGQTPSSYFANLKEQMARAYDNQDSGYEIDSLQDDELFILDALDKFGDENVTDEQLETLLANAKSDPDLYAKTIQNLKDFYQKREDDLNYQKQQEAAALEAQEYNNFSESILNQISSLDHVAGQEIELTPDDKNELANFILTRDESGNSEFGKMMDDPRVFTQLAFWALKGPSIINALKEQRRWDYNRGLQASNSGQSQLAFRSKEDGKKNKVESGSAFGLDVY